MKKCESCGQINKDDTKFCNVCGNKFVLDTNENNNFNPNTSQAQNNNDLNFKNKNNFVSDDEYLVATLSNGVVNNIISGEGIKSEGVFLTNKRFYYKFKTGILNIFQKNHVVDVKDITGTKIATVNNLGNLILAIFIFAAGIVIGFVADEFLFLPFSLLISLFFLILYFVTRKKFLRIEYAGGGINIALRKYSMKSITDFQKCIYSVKDKLDT